MHKPWAGNCNLAEDRSHREIVGPLAPVGLPACATTAVCLHEVGDLLLHHDALKLPRDGFALSQGQAQRFGLDVRPFQGGDLMCMALLVIGDRNDLKVD
jgi:hypothetical protein